jgi:hypothetical protein
LKRAYAAPVAIGLICLVAVGAIIVLLPGPLDLDELSWSVEVGDTLRYDIRAWGEAWGGSVPISLVIPLNDSSIDVTVVDLPTFNLIHNAATFRSEVIFKNKVDCLFTNGTELYEWANTTLSETISGCILPIGDWLTLDALFPDDPPTYGPGGDYLTTRLYDDLFTIKYGWWGNIDDGGSWTGNISLSTGAPSCILWMYYHGPGTPLYIELTLAE